MRVYLDNAASTPLDPEVFEYMKPYLCGEYIGNPSSVHHHGRQLRSVIEKARKTIAELIGAVPSEIFFTSGGTEADNTAIRGAVEAYDLKHIISTDIEHHAVTHVVEQLEKEGVVSKTYLPVDEKGNISLDDLRAALEANPKSLVSLMHGNNEIGTLHDIDAIGDICEEFGALFHSDTVQTIGSTAYNLHEMKVHFATASAHKFYGPKGVGFLYVKQGTKIPAMILGGSQERNMRAGTENVAAIAGMMFAFEKCQKNLVEKNAILWDLKQYMKRCLSEELEGVHFNGETDTHNSLPTVLNVCLPFEEDAMLIFNLDIAGISASSGSACTSGSMMGSHVLNTIGLKSHQALNSVRFSFGVQNTKEDIDYAVEKVKSLVMASVS